jgi:hypothetical protein
MSNVDLVRLLNSVGKKVFVDYYDAFSDPSLTPDDVFELLSKGYKESARRTRASKGRKICQEGFGPDALRIIADSEKVDPAAARKARQLLGEA